MSPLLETSIEGARGVLMNITGGSNLSLYEVNEAAEIVQSASDPDVNLIFGAVINEELKDEILVTVIATGFEERKPQAVHQMRKVPDLAVPSSQNEDRFSRDDFDIPTFLRNKNRDR